MDRDRGYARERELDDVYAAASGLDRPVDSRPNGSANGRPKVVQPTPQALPARQGNSAILVSTRQKGNPILNHVKQVPWEYSDIPADYVLGATTCALFLSLKYHRLHPEYIYTRIRALKGLYNLRVLLTMVDIENHEQALQELSKTSMINNLTLILAWSAQEAGRYIELFKSYEHAGPSSIRARQAETWEESLTEFITTPRNINKTDAGILITNFGSLRAAINAEPEQLALLSGWGEKKIKSWYTTVREPFRVKHTARATAHLNRQESSMMEDEESGNITPEPSALNPKPIGRVPATLSRGNTRPDAVTSESRPTSSHKRRLEEILPDDDFDDDAEAALLAAEEEASKATSQQDDMEKQKPEPMEAKKGPELSEGVAAALAKYRTNG